MAKASKSRGNPRQNDSYNSYGSNDRMGMDNDDDRSFFVIVVVVLMVVILLFVPLLSWMYIDLKMMEIRVNKMVGHIANQQALARKAELDKKRKAAWLKRQRAEEIQDKAIATVITFLMIAWIWLMLMIVRSSSLLSWS